MSNRMTHYSRQQMELIFREQGIHAADAVDLAKAISDFPFADLDRIHKAIGVIRKGVKS